MSGPDSEWIISVLSNEDAQTILTNQVNTYHHIQRQAQEALRIIVAGIALIVPVAIAASNVISPHKIQQVDENTPSYDLILGTLFSNILIFALLLILFGVLFLTCVNTFISVISPSFLYPGMGERERFLINEDALLNVVKNMGISPLSKTEWIESNSGILREKQYELSKAIRLLLISAGTLAVSLIVGWSLYEQNVSFLAFLNGMICMGVITGLLGIMLGFLRNIRESDSTRTKEIRNTIHNYRNFTSEIIEYIGPGWVYVAVICSLIIIIALSVSWFWLLLLWSISPSV